MTSQFSFDPIADTTTSAQNNAVIGNFVFEDVNKNGKQDIGESGISGVSVILAEAGADGRSGTDDDIIFSTVTDQNGHYLFENLAAGDYQVTFERPDGYEFTQTNLGRDRSKDSDADVTTGKTRPIWLDPGEHNLDLDAGLFRASDPVDNNNAAIGNFVFEDANQNGKQDVGETGIGGVQVILAEAGADGRSGTDDDIIFSTVTDQNGYYLFENLAAGDYQLTFERPDGFEFTQTNVGRIRSKDSDADVTTGKTRPIWLDPGEHNLDIDAGLIRTSTDNNNASLGNFVFEDLNKNGKQDINETGVADVQVSLSGAGADGHFGTADDIFQTTTTDANGLYSFDYLSAGDYKLTFEKPDGFEFTQAKVGRNRNRAVDSDANVTTGMTDVVSLSAGEKNLDIDAGLIRAGGPTTDPEDASIGDKVFEDVNGNGRRDRGEQGVAGVQVSLLGAGADGVFGTGDDITQTTTTSDRGNYRFTQLAAGDYKVTFDQPTGYEFTQANVGTNEARDSDADPTTGMTEVFSLAASEINNTIDAGLIEREPPKKDIQATIVGADWIDEGDESVYKVQLSEAVTEDTMFTLNVQDGSAQRVDRNDTQAANQDIMWGGYYSVGYVDYWGNWIRLAYQVEDRVANGTSLSSGDRPQIGPDGYTTWDYTVEKGNTVQHDGTVKVLVKAGETMSETFEVQTWKEKVTVDNAPWSVNTGYYEGTETFSINLTSAAGNSADNIFLGDDKTVDITDKTHYDFVSPLALDLNGDGVQTTALGATQGTFDLSGTGTAIESGWLSSEDAFLAVDSNGNGTIDNISELFGGDVGEGFAKLATYDTNGDGVIDSEEILGGGLTLWQDANSNHRTDAGELMSLASQGIASLDTAFVETPIYQNGNVLIEHGAATKIDGSKIDLVDAYFQIAETSSALTAPGQENALV